MTPGIAHPRPNAPPARMRAAVLAAPRTFRLEEVPLPTPTARQVRVRLEGCGVCGSNLVPWEGKDWFQYPFSPGAMGHEGWGVIDAVGEEVQDWKVGERVALLSGAAYAEYDVADTDALVRLPPELAGKPFPGEALGCVMNIWRRSDIQQGHTVAVVGVGFLGGLLIQLARAAGARVIAVSRRPFSLELAKRCGAHETVVMDDHQRVLARMKELTGGRGCERVIEAVGLQWPLDLAAELTAERGRLVIAGYHQDGPRQVNMWLWNWRGLDVINAHERDRKVYREGIQLAVQAVLEGKLDPFPLLTHRYALEEVGRAFSDLHARPDGFLKAVVTP